MLFPNPIVLTYNGSMARVVFTANLKRYVSCPEAEVPGGSVADVLFEIFKENAQLKGYVVDEHGALHPHMVVFVDGQAIKDRTGLTDAVSDDSEIYVMQALSGGK